MKIGDLVKSKAKNKIGIIIGKAKTHLCVGVMYGVFIDGMKIAFHETDLEVINE